MRSGEERQLAEYLRDKGLKFTPERRLILEEVRRMRNHFEAEDIVSRIRERGRRVSRASVYRTLPLLVDSGLLREVHSMEKHSHFEHIFGHEHHDHLICKVCGKTVEFLDPQIEELQDRVCAEHGFQLDFHKLEITGICGKCASRKEI